jgi:hypothetical protein
MFCLGPFSLRIRNLIAVQNFIFSVIYYIPEALGLADELQSPLKDHRTEGSIVI